MEVIVLLNAATTAPTKPYKPPVIGADREPREMIVPRSDRIAEQRLWIWLAHDAPR